MDFSSSQWIQLNVAAILGLMAFVLLYMAPLRWIVPTLILIIPFQIIASRYGSFNVYLVYLIAFVLALRGQLREFPYTGFVAFIAFAYALSLSQSPPMLLREHLFYLFITGASFLVFYIVYNYYRHVEDPRAFLYVLLIMNALVLVYSGAQLIVGMNPNSPLFSESFGLRPPRDDGRLTGPFGAVGLTAEYMVMAVFISGFLLLTMKPGPLLRGVLITLILGSLGAMIATANRGAVFSLVLAGIFFLYLFRKELGTRGIAISLIGLPLAFALSAAVVINFTDFNLLFERLADTEIEEGLPDTRSTTWPMAWSRIQERPILGHGPQLKFSEETYAKKGAPEFILWPHNLYLFLWYTLGIVGLLAYLAFLGRLFLEYKVASGIHTNDPILNALPRLGMVLMAVFVIDQMKIEFLRDRTTEYAHFAFMIWGALAAFAVNGRLMSNVANAAVQQD